MRTRYKARKVVGVFSERQRQNQPMEGVPRKEDLRIHVVETPDEIQRFNQFLARKHYLGGTQPAGDFLRQVVKNQQGQWLALLAWGAACYRIKDRDEWIGWNNTQRAERQKLVVQNRRYLLLSRRGQRPNLGSQALALAVRELSGQWEKQFGYQPVLAETFTDMELFEGTCYKASGWEAVGQSKGYSRHRAEFYIKHDRPKKLWLKKLQPDAQEILCAMSLGKSHQKGGCSNAQSQLPFKAAEQKSLIQALARVSDQRAENSCFKLTSVLSIVAMALLCGSRQMSQISRFGSRLSQAQRRNLGLPLRKGTVVYRVPSYSVYYQMLKRIDPMEFSQVLSQWLQSHHGSLPSALALDGKMIGDLVGVVSLVEHETGIPVSMAPMSKKESPYAQGELKTGQHLLQSQTLDGKIMTADALHTQIKTAQITVEQGGEYLLQIKSNQKKLLKFAKAQTDKLPPFFR